MSSLPWKDAIIKVLQDSPDAMHYTDIAEEIAKRALRAPTDLGATPASTVNAVISTSIQYDGDSSPFARVERGRYWLRTVPAGAQPIEHLPPSAEAEGHRSHQCIWNVLVATQSVVDSQPETSWPAAAGQYAS